jgi:hypothetical protein
VSHADLVVNVVEAGEDMLENSNRILSACLIFAFAIIMNTTIFKSQPERLREPAIQVMQASYLEIVYFYSF